MLQARGVNLSCVRSCVVVAEERPRLVLTHSFSKLFKDLGLSPRAVSTAFGSRVNLAVCMQVRTPDLAPHNRSRDRYKPGLGLVLLRYPIQVQAAETCGEVMLAQSDATGRSIPLS